MEYLEADILSLLPVIEKVYRQTLTNYLEERYGAITGRVYSAIPLVGDQLSQLEQVFSKKFARQVKLESHIDTSLLGGYKVEINNQVFDDTVDMRMKQLKEKLYFS